MDHHCYFIHNCVAYHNFNYYARYCLVVAVLSATLLLMILYEILFVAHAPDEEGLKAWDLPKLWFFYILGWPEIQNWRWFLLDTCCFSLCFLYLLYPLGVYDSFRTNLQNSTSEPH